MNQPHSEWRILRKKLRRPLHLILSVVVAAGVGVHRFLSHSTTSGTLVPALQDASITFAVTFVFFEAAYLCGGHFRKDDLVLSPWFASFTVGGILVVLFGLIRGWTLTVAGLSVGAWALVLVGMWWLQRSFQR